MPADNKTFKPILQVMADGTKVKWPSIKAAAETLKIDNSHLRECIRFNKPAKGFYFEKDLTHPRWKNKHGKLDSPFIYSSRQQIVENATV